MRSHTTSHALLALFSSASLTVCLLVVAPTLQAQPPSGQADTASVRFWKADLRGFANLRVMMSTPGRKHPAVSNLGGGGPGFVFANYLTVSAGKCDLEVFDGPAPAAGKPESHPLVSQPVNFAPGTFTTILMEEPEKAGEPPHLEIIEDGGRDGKSPSDSAQLTVRNFVGDLKGIKVSIGDSLNAEFASGAGFLVMHGIKPATYQVHTSGTTSGGKAFEWSNEVNLRQNRHQTLLIYPDPYGRIRPQLSVDGENLMEPVQDQDKGR